MGRMVELRRHKSLKLDQDTSRKVDETKNKVFNVKKEPEIEVSKSRVLLNSSKGNSPTVCASVATKTNPMLNSNSLMVPNSVPESKTTTTSPCMNHRQLLNSSSSSASVSSSTSSSSCSPASSTSPKIVSSSANKVGSIFKLNNPFLTNCN